MNQLIKIILISVMVGGISGGIVTTALNQSKTSKDELIKEFYLVENAVHVSPHGLRKKMDKVDTSYVLVDLRSAEEYEKAHIVGAVNIPAYKDPDTSAYEEVERIVGEFKKLPQEKEVIVYCYSTACMTGRKIGKILAERGIYVEHLGIGWNEWRHFWTTWNHEHEWNVTKPEEYIATGKEPGTPTRRELPSACGDGELSC